MKKELYGELRVIGMKGCEEFVAQVDAYLKDWRKCNPEETFLVDHACPRFGSGEAKCVINQTLRGDDVYIITDCFNYSVTYNMYGMKVPMSPDDHYCDLKRTIAAIAGKARRITVIMLMLYEGRQHKRSARESLDCAVMLQELIGMGVSNFLTFDAHDPRINNAIPLNGFDNVQPTYQMIKALLKSVPDIIVDKDQIDELLGELRRKTPEEIKRYQKIIDNKDALFKSHLCFLLFRSFLLPVLPNLS